jgi:hypothetical protein
MAEKLLDASGITLFGQVVSDLVLSPSSGIGGGFGNIVTRMQPEGGAVSPIVPVFARIYGFSYEGQYFEMVRPAIFLLSGNGTEVPDSLEGTGLAAKPPGFRSDLFYWRLDQSDFSVRLDVEVGQLERILLDAEIGPDQRVTMSGQNVRYAGQNIRYSGQNVRMSAAGQNVRLRYAGQNVRGGGD